MDTNLKLERRQQTELRTILDNPGSTKEEFRRAQAILLLDQEMSPPAISAMTRYSRRHIFTLRQRYVAEGKEAIRDKRDAKPRRLLTRAQRAAVVETIKTKRPDELGSYYQHYPYWTTGILGAYIKRTYKVEYKSKTSEYLLFKEAKFSYHKPGKVSERQDPEEVEAWRTEAKNRVAAVWDDPNVVILAEDEMNLSNQTTIQKIWLPQGEYPRIEIAREREARSLYGFLNIKEGKEHSFKTRWQNMYITAEVIPKIRAVYPDKHILLVWDQAGWHKGREAQHAIKIDGNIEQIYFPTAAPELNPQEHVWKSGRSNITHNAFIRNIDASTDDFVEYLNTTPFPYSLLGFSAIS